MQLMLFQKLKIPNSVRDALLPLAERGARQAGSDLVRLSVAGRIPTDLIQKLLIVEQEDFLLVDSVDRVGRWGIQIESAKRLEDLNHTRLGDYCTNRMLWEEKLAYEDRHAYYAFKLITMPDGFGTDMMHFHCFVSL
ncbi:hypothetical protein [uncultured Sulfitobacter sp.]|uniref:hypothetical protein n=1 Tax=uncultured Sulfitobacter sp. TaxID=191468 RepID=UPI00260BFAF0|nr:hypothetical protein [uncultured Sulfitobacter sp.]